MLIATLSAILLHCSGRYWYSIVRFSKKVFGKDKIPKVSVWISTKPRKEMTNETIRAKLKTEIEAIRGSNSKELVISSDGIAFEFVIPDNGVGEEDPDNLGNNVDCVHIECNFANIYIKDLKDELNVISSELRTGLKRFDHILDLVDYRATVSVELANKPWFAQALRGMDWKEIKAGDNRSKIVLNGNKVTMDTDFGEKDLKTLHEMIVFLNYGPSQRI